MKYLIPLSILIILVTSIKTPSSICVEDSEWTTIFEDEFEGDELNTNHWNIRTGDGYGSYSRNSYLTNENVYL